MEDRSFKTMLNSNFVKRVFSAILIIPLMILPILFGGYTLITVYLLILTLVFFELFAIIRNTKHKIYSIIYLFISTFSIFSFNILLLSSNVNELFISIIILIWIFDTFSYLGGSYFKGRKIFPSISKGKTYSGLICGTFASVAIYSSAISNINSEQTISYSALFIIIILSFLGDTLVSFLKRSASMKDSGNLLPGHGGFLDRLDSFILVFFAVGGYFLFLL
tara:strand:- start:402 stop:1064 length:663 start_codon:yes stop_codon:yes gene_type:complete